MIEILDIPSIRERVAPISIEDYHAMIDAGRFDDRSVELLEGVIVDKMSKTELHLFLVVLLEDLLKKACDGLDLWVRKEDPIETQDSEPEADLSVVEGSFRDYRNTKPTTARFVIEVAVTSLARDRAKAPIYASAGIPEYWIVRPEDEVIEVYRNPRAGIYADSFEVSSNETIDSVAIPSFSLCLAKEISN
ncbi:MAG: Uma2 family endonuclease [Verrucomicrobiales bacterium]|jgi:Uma2 family endonuclease